MNVLNFLMNVFWIFLEIKQTWMYIGIQKTLIDVIAFISNMENVMMGDYYIMEKIQKENNLKIKSNENFKVLINNYILKDYYIFKNEHILNQNIVTDLISLIKSLLFNFETFLIGSQKLLYEYINYFKYLFNWYNNFKILINKSIINTNIREELYYNISLELLSDIQNDYNRSLWWTIQNIKKLDKNLLIQLFKNYFKKFNENPYKVSIELMHLYKNYSKVNLLSYGLNYDINILTHNKYILSALNVDILSSKTNFTNLNKIIKNIDKEQYFILHNNSVFKPILEKKDINFYLAHKNFNNYIEKFMKSRWNVAHNFINKTYTSARFKWWNVMRLKLLNNKFINFNFLNDSILVQHWSFHNVFKSQPGFFFSSIQRIARFFVGTKEHLNPDKVSEIIAGKKEILNLKNVLDMKKLDSDIKNDTINLFKLRKLYGGYSYWWGLFQDGGTAPVHEVELTAERTKRTRRVYVKRTHWLNIPRLVNPKKDKFNIVGIIPLYFKMSIIPDAGITLKGAIYSKKTAIQQQISNLIEYRPGGQSTNMERVYELFDELEELLKPDSKFNKDIKDFAEFEKSSFYEPLNEFDKFRKFEEFKRHRELQKSIPVLNKEGTGFIAKDKSIGTDEIMYDIDMEALAKEKKLAKERNIRRNLRRNFNDFVIEKRYLREDGSFHYRTYRWEQGIRQAHKKESERAHNDPLHKFPHRYPKAKQLIRFAYTLDFENHIKKDQNKYKKGIKTLVKYYDPKKYYDFMNVDKTKKGGYKHKVFLNKELNRLGINLRTKKWHSIKKLFRILRYLNSDCKRIPFFREKITKKIVINGNIGLEIIKNYFRKFLIANDIWIDVKFRKKRDLVKIFKPTIKWKQDFKTNASETKVIKKLKVSRVLGKFVNITDLTTYNDDYRRFAKLKLRQYALYKLNPGFNLYWEIIELFFRAFKGEKWKQTPYEYILKGNMWNKQWLKEVKNVVTPEQFNEMPKKYKTYKTIRKFHIKNRNLMELTVKYNTPIKYKKLNTHFYKKMYITPIPKIKPKMKYYYFIMSKFLEYYFYPELNYKLKKLGFEKPDLLIELKDASLKKLAFNKEYKFKYDLKIKFNIYKSVIKRDFFVKLLKTKNVTNISFRGIRGFLMYMFNFDVFANVEYLSTKHYIRKNVITWGNFYHTNIESITEPLNLNIIHKTFYGKHVNKGFNYFLYKKADLVTDTILPRNRNILMKKAYIKNLVYVYEKEDKPIINYLLYLIKIEEFKIIHKAIINIISIIWEILDIYFKKYISSWKEIIEFFLELIEQELLRFREVRTLSKHLKQHPEYIIYIIITIIIFFYTIICIFLILIIKTFLPKNLIYGKIFKKDNKSNIDLYNNNNNVENIKLENFIKIISELENIIGINLDNLDIEEIEKQIKDKNDSDIITANNLKKLELYIKLKKINKFKIKKNFFDSEQNYVYSWENKDFDLLEEIKKAKKLKKVIPLENKRFLKKRIYINKFEENKVNDLKKKYVVFYKNFIFEKNLEKWENNTKRRLDFFFNKEGKGIIRLILTDIWRSFLDRKFNHNRILFWNDPDLEDTSHITYMFKFYRPFANVFFIIKFIWASLEIFNYKYWLNRWYKYIAFGKHEKINYKKIRIYLEKIRTLEWFKDNIDYRGLEFKDFVKLIRHYKEIKEKPLNKKISDKKKLRDGLINSIIGLTLEKDKLEEINKYLVDLNTIEVDRTALSFEEKFKKIETYLTTNIDKIGPYKWLEQELRFKYRNQVYKKKLQFEKEEYKKKNIEKEEYKKKIVIIEYEKDLRAYNYNNNYIDLELDKKDKEYYESIKEYNEDLSEEELKIKKKKTEEKIEQNENGRKTFKLFGLLEENYIYYRSFTTMGARFNYIFVLITGIFVGWWDNIKKIRKNEFTILSLFSIIKIDLFKYIYKIYWEYLFIWNKYKVLEKWGFNIKEILKFSIILTPIFLYSTFLYSIFFLYFLLFIILFILPKNIYIKIKENIKKILIKKTIRNILSYFIYIWKIINFLFKNIETGETLLILLYNKFYKLCGKIQYNIYMLKGAFILGYTNNDNNEKNIKKGLISIWTWLKLKYTSFLEQRREKNKNKNKIDRIKENFYKLKENFYRRKENFEFKLKILNILTISSVRFKFRIKRIRWKIMNFFYDFFYNFFLIKFFFNIEKIEFIIIFRNNTQLFNKYFLNIINTFVTTFINAVTNVNIKDLIILIIKTIWKFLILPFVFIINHQKWKYVNNYKKGIQGFRNNPMRKIIDNPVIKYDWQLKLHNILMERDISYYLRNLLSLSNTWIDIFFMFKIYEVKWTNKNYYQDFFWRSCYWQYKVTKKIILNFLIDLMSKTEEYYASFERSVETQNWTIWEKIRYAFYTIRLYNHTMTRKTQQRKSRDRFFYKKAKDRKKIMRIYFIKGVINWITYITINKIFFTKIHNLKKKHMIYKYLRRKYKLKDLEARAYISKNIHLTEELQRTPPQLWALVIMYEIYYRSLLKYRFRSYDGYPEQWIDKVHSPFLADSEDYKWRLPNPIHTYAASAQEKLVISKDVANLNFRNFMQTLTSEPYDPMLRWILFLVEYGMSAEEIIGAGDIIWLPKESDAPTSTTWGDISLTHLLTYDKEHDQYKYEVKEFHRLMKKSRRFLGFKIDFDFTFNPFRVAENKLERDKIKHFEEQFKLVSSALLEANKDILNNILKERRKIRAIMLHKALSRHRAKSSEEIKEEQAKERDREFFLSKRKEFFDDWEIEEYWDWQAEHDEDAIETKYFTAAEMHRKVTLAHMYEEMFFKQRKKLDYSYLLDDIILRSYDQTMEEIHYFLKFKAWKILEKRWEKKKKKNIIQINYKNLNIGDEYLSRINYDSHIKYVGNKIGTDRYYDYMYEKLEWPHLKYNSDNWIDNDLLGDYMILGRAYSYEDKIAYNPEAKEYQLPSEPYRGNKILKIWLKKLSKRDKTLQNIKKKSIKKKKELPLNIAYINNIKWTWEQWLIYTDVENENKILNKNTVILNERFNLWNLKRVPIRIRLPVTLSVDLFDLKDYITDKSNYASWWNHRHIMSLGKSGSMLKQALIWEECKKMLEKKFDKNITDLVTWIFTAEAYNREVQKIKEDYNFVFKNFIKNYNIFHRLYYLGMSEYTWDLIRYHEVFWDTEDFPYDKYFQLKQMEYLNHDPLAKELVRHLYFVYLDKYNPIAYTHFFREQFSGRYLYHIFGILSISCAIWTLKVLMYNPGEFIAENYILFTPIGLTMIFWYFRRCVKTFKDSSQGKEIYLYRYRSSRAFTPVEKMRRKDNLERQKKEWTEHFYDKDKILKIFPNGIESLNTDLEEDWWRYYSYRNKDDKVFQFEHVKWWVWIMICFNLSVYWRVYSFKYRNSEWLWSYYRSYKQFAKFIESQGIDGTIIRIPRNYHERQWFKDSWTRLENGGNWYSRWYENVYRYVWNLDEKELDYGHYWQKVSGLDYFIKIDGKKYNFGGAFADLNWIRYSKTIEQYNKLSDELKNFKRVTPEWFFREKPNTKRNRWRKIKADSKKRQEKLHIFKKNIDWEFENPKRRELSNLEYLIKEIKVLIDKLREGFKVIYLKDRYIAKKHPLKKWAEFLFWVEDKFNYDTLGNVYARFLIKSQKETEALIIRDFKRYRLAHLQGKGTGKMEKLIKKIKKNLEDYNIFNYIELQEIKRNNKLNVIRRNCLNVDNKRLDMNTILSISETEKHLIHLRFQFLKYEQCMVLRHLLHNKKYYYKEEDKLAQIKFYKNQINIKVRALKDCDKFLKDYYLENKFYNLTFLTRNIDSLKKDVVHKYRYCVFRLKKIEEIAFFKELYLKNSAQLKRYCNYLDDLKKKTDSIERVEYRYNVLMHFLKKREDFWIFIRDFTIDISLMDVLKVTLKIIMKIFE